jgi:hypothetical protein
VNYTGADCELWVIDRGTALAEATYVAIAKYENATPIASIADDTGSAFTVKYPEPEYDTTVYSAKIDVIDRDLGYVVFDGTTKQVITIVTGKDVTKIQLLDDATKATMTYNMTNTNVKVSTAEQEGKEVLVWTITRLFAKNTYNYSINTRSPLGLVDSGVDLSFKVADLPEPEEKLISVSAVGTEEGNAVFTVVTIDTASKVKFTNIKDGGTMTIAKDNAKANVVDNGNGTLTWTISIKHIRGVETTYDCQTLIGSKYSDAKQVSVLVPLPVEESSAA